MALRWRPGGSPVRGGSKQEENLTTEALLRSNTDRAAPTEPHRPTYTDGTNTDGTYIGTYLGYKSHADLLAAVTLNGYPQA